MRLTYVCSLGAMSDAAMSSTSLSAAGSDRVFLMARLMRRSTAGSSAGISGLSCDTHTLSAPSELGVATSLPLARPATNRHVFFDALHSSRGSSALAVSSQRARREFSVRWR
jgi:hypothetical protein